MVNKLPVRTDITDLESQLTDVETDVTTIYSITKYQRFEDKIPLAPVAESKTTGTEVAITSPATVTITYPSSATKQRISVLAMLKAINMSGTACNIGVRLQINPNGGGLQTIRSLKTYNSLALPAVNRSSDALVLHEDITSFITASGQTVTFSWTVDNDSSYEIHYTQQFTVIVTYDYSSV